MEQGMYDQIVAIILKELHQKDCVKTLVKEFPDIPEETLTSIYSQQYQSYTKAVHGRHRKPETMTKYYSQYTSAMSDKVPEGENRGTILLDMAKKVQFSPVLFARIILEQHILSHDLLPSPNTNPSSVVSQWIKSPRKIPDVPLQEQVKQCILGDTNYGPLGENIKHSIGYQYEFLLKEKVEELGVPFLDETALRRRGYDKTPDCKLEVPIAIGDYTVSWIESKASFGDRQSHRKYLEDQFWGYQNRFGSGLVIYWFGFLKELDVHRKQGIMLMDHFPTNITTLDSLLKENITT